MARQFSSSELAVLCYLDAARKQGLRVQLDYRFPRAACLRTTDAALPALACDFLAVRSLQAGGYLMWLPPHVHLTAKGKRALRLYAAAPAHR